MARHKLIAGNWKMNGLRADGLALAAELALQSSPEPTGAETISLRA